MADLVAKNFQYAVRLGKIVKEALITMGLKSDFDGACRGLSVMAALHVINDDLALFMQQIIKIVSATKLEAVAAEVIKGIALFMEPGAFNLGAVDLKISQRYVAEIQQKLAEVCPELRFNNKEPLDLILFKHGRYDKASLKLYLNKLRNILFNQQLPHIPIILSSGEHSIVITCGITEEPSLATWQIVDSNNLVIWEDGPKTYTVTEIVDLIVESFCSSAIYVMSIDTEMYMPKSYLDNNFIEPLFFFKEFVKPEDGVMLFDCVHSCTGEIIQKLMQIGVDLKVKDSHHRTLLHWFTAIGNKEVVAVLLQANISIDPNDPSLLSLAIDFLVPFNKAEKLRFYENYLQIAELLIRAGANKTKLFESIKFIKKIHSSALEWAPILVDLERLKAITPQVMSDQQTSLTSASQMTPMFYSGSSLESSSSIALQLPSGHEQEVRLEIEPKKPK